MHADYDSDARAVSLCLGRGRSAAQADQIHPRAIVALRDGRAVEVQLLYPELGIEEPLRAAAARYQLDLDALLAAARAAVSAPDRAIDLHIAAA
jgi:hypothetical protein